MDPVYKALIRRSLIVVSNTKATINEIHAHPALKKIAAGY
jgi:hypothetical protein